ncbi:hypothetical protein [Salmonella enterica]|uniref:hypothetical protein n=1 Tax=Salmonella enterica TaxID=28901 RepID=UPI00215518C6|nr:hypothetical protein [Salmonella enterica]
MSYLEYINEVKVSGIVISAVEKKMTDQSIGLLIKLKNRMKTEVDGEITEREFSCSNQRCRLKCIQPVSLV